MTAKDIKNELRTMGYCADLTRDGTGYAFKVYRWSCGRYRCVGEGWSRGSKTDALREAYDVAKSLQKKEADRIAVNVAAFAGPEIDL